ncbi:hypothetical protein EYC80_004366 [Monilinia laxa]|uniref:Uncharacterized protein n=1 Tax=Monilinia laxa TaxID=61186 RepID=A0A5N6KMY4_MONLA|nr:hypothetical protein EYC80_004366 [Monilinia laxa]
MLSISNRKVKSLAKPKEGITQILRPTSLIPPKNPLQKSIHHYRNPKSVRLSSACNTFLISSVLLVHT